MTIQLKVPSIACGSCAETISKEITKNQPEAEVSIDIQGKIVTIETDASESAIIAMIESVGHTVISEQ